MNQCNQNLSDDAADESYAGRALTFSLCSNSNDLPAFVSVWLPNDEIQLELTETQQAKLFCHFLIHQLPDAAFSETVESLVSVYEYYRSLPDSSIVPLQSPTIKARITDSYMAPVFPITEE